MKQTLLKGIKLKGTVFNSIPFYLQMGCQFKKKKKQNAIMTFGSVSLNISKIALFIMNIISSTSKPH